MGALKATRHALVIDGIASRSDPHDKRIEVGSKLLVLLDDAIPAAEAQASVVRAAREHDRTHGTRGGLRRALRRLAEVEEVPHPIGPPEREQIGPIEAEIREILGE